MKRSHESLRCVSASRNGKRRRRNGQQTRWNRCGSFRPDAEVQVGSWVMAIERDGLDHIESRRATQVINRAGLGAIAQKSKGHGVSSSPVIIVENAVSGVARASE